VVFTAQILIIVACAGVFAWLLTINQVARRLGRLAATAECFGLDAASRN